MNELFPILAIETSGESCSVALMLSEEVFYEYNIRQKHVHSEKLLPVINTLLDNSGLKPENVTTVAVSMGPGSFTGLRIGLAAGKGFALGAKCKISAVPTFHAAAISIANVLKEGEEFSILINTNIEEAYLSDFIVKDGKPGILTETKLVLKKDINNSIILKENVYGNVAGIDNIHPLDFNALNVAKWTYFFGKDLLISNFDLLEPSYFKNFVARIKK